MTERLQPRGTVTIVSVYPSLKGAELLRILCRDLGYSVVRQKGSHRTLESDQGYARLLFAFHDGDTIAPGMVRKILMKDVALSDEEARKLL